MARLTIEELKKLRESARRNVDLRQGNLRGKVIVHMGTCGMAAGARDIVGALKHALEKRSITDIVLTTSGCAGLCSMEPMITVQIADSAPVKYGRLTAEKARRIFDEHILGGQAVTECALEKLMCTSPETGVPIPLISDIPFFKKQVLVVLRNKGIIDPEKIDDYIGSDGYLALEKVLTSMSPEEVIAEVSRSGLRGRGGAGFPTGTKWKVCRTELKTPKYIVGNCDEGDPGAFMDRSLLESDPHSVLEGMAIAAYAIGAAKGYVYIRTEYPLAIQRMRDAIMKAREYGLLGQRILNSHFSFDIEIREGSGAFVCGEETSLIHSIEGAIPEPRQRPPFPAQSGLWGCPTVINNVETLANVPAIISRGAAWYTRIGTESSKGTKIFSLVGKINNTGLIEVPMGISLREIVYEIGGGIPGGKKLKAVQTGGPSGGCIPAHLAELPVDYESLRAAGSMMGSGGMIVLDEDTCVVDVSKFFLQFTNDESCGKCVSCRDGSAALLEVLTRISDGEGREGDLEFLEELAHAVKDASMCGLGQTVPNPVLSTLRYFRDEYEAHIKYKRCPAAVCQKIISSACRHTCPLGTDIPAYVALIARGDFIEAARVIRETNPLPNICGRVCHHPCERKCVAGESGEPVAIAALKRFAMDYERRAGKSVPPAPVKTQDEQVAIVGSGPAGLTAGYVLARQGYDVTIFEAAPRPGGMLALAIPEYRLPSEILDLDIDAIQKAGVKIKTGMRLGKDMNIDTLFQQGFRAVFLALGAHRSLRLGIPGEEVAGVLDPLELLRKIRFGEDVRIGGKVGIVGGGNTAIDAARTVYRLGVKNVTVMYRRTMAEMPAIRDEIEQAINEGVRIEFLVAPTKVLSSNGKLTGLECIRMRLGGLDKSGRPEPIPIAGSEFRIDLDNLIPAISQQPDASILSPGDGVRISEAGMIQVHPETLATARQGVFAGGDAVSGPATVTEAMAAGKTAAESIHRYLRGLPLERKYEVTKRSIPVEPLQFSDQELEELAELRRLHPPELPIEERRSGFGEVFGCPSEQAAVAEARRCLRCDLRAETASKDR